MIESPQMPPKNPMFGAPANSVTARGVTESPVKKISLYKSVSGYPDHVVATDNNQHQ